MHYYNEIKKELVSYFKELVRFDIKNISCLSS